MATNEAGPIRPTTPLSSLVSGAPFHPLDLVEVGIERNRSVDFRKGGWRSVALLQRLRYSFLGDILGAHPIRNGDGNGDGNGDDNGDERNVSRRLGAKRGSKVWLEGEIGPPGNGRGTRRGRIVPAWQMAPPARTRHAKGRRNGASPVQIEFQEVHIKRFMSLTRNLLRPRGPSLW